MNLQKLTETMARAHKTACEKGWYDKPINDSDQLCNLISELMEAWNEFAHNRGIAEIYLTGENGTIENGVPVELADYAIRACDLLGYWQPSQKTLMQGLEEGAELAGILKDAGSLTRMKLSELLVPMAMMVTEGSGDCKMCASNLVRSLQLLEAWCEAHDINLPFVMKRKMSYNETREYRHGGKRV